MRRLTEKDLQKLSVILDTPLVVLQKLCNMNMLNDKTAVRLLIKHDFHHIRKGGKFTVKQILQAIQTEYQVSMAMIGSIIYETKKQEFVCKECGTAVRRAELIRNNGMCDTCVSKTINL